MSEGRPDEEEREIFIGMAPNKIHDMVWGYVLGMVVERIMF